MKSFLMLHNLLHETAKQFLNSFWHSHLREVPAETFYFISACIKKTTQASKQKMDKMTSPKGLALDHLLTSLMNISIDPSGRHSVTFKHVSQNTSIPAPYTAPSVLFVHLNICLSQG